MSASDVAHLIKQLKTTYIASSFGLVMLNDRDLPNWLISHGYDLGSNVRLGRKDNTYYEGLDLYAALATVQGNPQFNLTFLGVIFTAIISWVGDALSQNSYFDKTPELEFFRHIRNGISHGNKFNFVGNEPSRPAQFANFILTNSLHGQTVLFEFISTGDIFDLLDHLETHLRTIV